MKMRTFLIYIVFLFAALAAVASDSDYDLFMSGEKVGSCTIDLNRYGEGYIIKTSSSTTARRGERTFSEEITVNSEWLPGTYTMSTTTPQGETEISATFSDESVELVGKFGMGQMTKSLHYKEHPSVWSEEMYLASVLILLARMDYSATNKPVKFAVIVPEKMEFADATLSVTGQDGESYVVSGSQPGGWEFETRYDPTVNRLEHISVSNGFEAQPAKQEKPEPGLPAGYHPLTPMILADKEFIKRLGETEILTGTLSMSFSTDVTSRLYLNNFSQEFAGEITSTGASGTVEVKKMGHKVTNAPDWPLYYPRKGYDEIYLLPERGIDSDDPGIIARAKKTVEPAVTMWDAARAINIWVNRNVKYDTVTAGALETFESKAGDSRAKALLCAAICRAAGIPARIVSGILWADGATDHTWVEVYLGEKAGWGPMDPTLNEADKLSAAHISLWLGTQWPPAFAKDVTLENVVTEE